MISTLRHRASHGHRRDRAILDLLELQELRWIPGTVRTEQLQELWQCSQPQVSRRLAAIRSLKHWRVVTIQGCNGGAWIAPPTAVAVSRPAPTPLSPRQRWERLRGRLA